MNADRLAGNWKELKGKLKQRWGNLTDDDLESTAGKREQLLRKIQQRYGIAREEAEAQVKELDALLQPSPRE